MLMYFVQERYPVLAQPKSLYHRAADGYRTQQQFGNPFKVTTWGHLKVTIWLPKIQLFF